MVSRRLGRLSIVYALIPTQTWPIGYVFKVNDVTIPFRVSVILKALDTSKLEHMGHTKIIGTAFQGPEQVRGMRLVSIDDRSTSYNDLASN